MGYETAQPSHSEIVEDLRTQIKGALELSHKDVEKERKKLNEEGYALKGKASAADVDQLTELIGESYPYVWRAARAAGRVAIVSESIDDSSLQHVSVWYRHGDDTSGAQDATIDRTA